MGDLNSNLASLRGGYNDLLNVQRITPVSTSMITQPPKSLSYSSLGSNATAARQVIGLPAVVGVVILNNNRDWANAADRIKHDEDTPGQAHNPDDEPTQRCLLVPASTSSWTHSRTVIFQKGYNYPNVLALFES